MSERSKLPRRSRFRTPSSKNSHGDERDPTSHQRLFPGHHADGRFAARRRLAGLSRRSRRRSRGPWFAGEDRQGQHPVEGQASRGSPAPAAPSSPATRLWSPATRAMARRSPRAWVPAARGAASGRAAAARAASFVRAGWDEATGAASRVANGTRCSLRPRPWCLPIRPTKSPKSHLRAGPRVSAHSRIPPAPPARVAPGNRGLQRVGFAPFHRPPRRPSAHIRGHDRRPERRPSSPPCRRSPPITPLSAPTAWRRSGCT